MTGLSLETERLLLTRELRREEREQEHAVLARAEGRIADERAWTRAAYLRVERIARLRAQIAAVDAEIAEAA